MVGTRRHRHSHPLKQQVTSSPPVPLNKREISGYRRQNKQEGLRLRLVHLTFTLVPCQTDPAGGVAGAVAGGAWPTPGWTLGVSWQGRDGTHGCRAPLFRPALVPEGARDEEHLRTPSVFLAVRADTPLTLRAQPYPLPPHRGGPHSLCSCRPGDLLCDVCTGAPLGRRKSHGGQPCPPRMETSKAATQDAFCKAQEDL